MARTPQYGAARSRSKALYCVISVQSCIAPQVSGACNAVRAATVNWSDSDAAQTPAAASNVVKPTAASPREILEQISRAVLTSPVSLRLVIWSLSSSREKI
ncbi:MAG: hypothetical protein GC196_16000 [Hyphomonas sp.]|nr:hypothetical protein [Hyphomonas sp.]